MSEVLDAALEYAAAGWAVFPLSGKLPAIAKTEGGNGFHDAISDPDQVRAWWTRWPAANIGLAVPRGTVVIDVDPRHGGEESLARFEAEHGTLALTLATITGSGGRHLWFHTLTDHLEQKPIAAGIDSRVGGKGYVLAPPSVHPETRQPYQWHQPLAPIAPLPEWVRACLRKRVEARTYDRPQLHILDGGVGLLEWAFDRVRMAGEGSRHTTLRNTAILLGGHVAGGNLREDDARDVLRRASAGWPNQHKTEGTIEDGLAHGRQRPLEAS